jgi:hypothetical protein
MYLPNFAFIAISNKTLAEFKLCHTVHLILPLKFYFVISNGIYSTKLFKKN